jgi:chromosome segregation ATPase
VGEPSQSGQRVTVDQAARHLGLTVDAVRKRVQRGQIAHEKDGAGRVRIILDSGETLRDESPDTTGPATHELVEELRDRVRYLERQVEEERSARYRADELLARLMDRVQLEAPQEAPEDAETVEEATDELGAERARREVAETTLHEGMAEERRRREEAERERDELRRELYARREPRESPETVEEASDSAEPRPDTLGAQESVQRPWWRKLIGR